MKKKFQFKRWQVFAFLLLCADAASVIIAYFLALLFRFDCLIKNIPAELTIAYQKAVLWYLLLVIPVYFSFKLYHYVWRFASVSVLIRCGVAGGVSALLIYGVTSFFFPRMPFSYFIFGGILQFLALVCSRFSFRFLLCCRDRFRRKREEDEGILKRVMIVGGGPAGVMILRDIVSSIPSTRVCCIIDDDDNKWGRELENVPIAGGRDKIQSCAKEYGIDEILIAISTATFSERQKLISLCKETGCAVKILPGINQLVTGEVTLAQMREVTINDLLERKPIVLDNTKVLEQLRDKIVLVTGGGGSIGSELCRQIAGHSPKQLIIFDIYENNVYEIEQELRRHYPELNLVALIGSVRDTRRINAVFETYHPEFVYHAAAHKHVPLMENSPFEAIKNNVIGTCKAANAALQNGCRRFLLISTDKAVNPTNIMGASKRLCEMVIQSMNTISQTQAYNLLPSIYSSHSTGETPPEFSGPANGVHTEFVAVRFGNVLGSNGSVVPLFKQQIAEGGPVRVTHKDIIRYFMTIPEAVSLVIQAGTLARGGEIFVLDMGDPVKIDDLARNMIILSGLRPDVDIKIEYTGLRPGEKLFEEKLMMEEGLERTANNLIHIAHPMEFDIKKFMDDLANLSRSVYERKEDIFTRIEQLVPTYHRKK